MTEEKAGQSRASGVDSVIIMKDEKGDFKIGQSDVCLGIIEDCEFWMSKDQFEYWKFTQLTIHVVEGRGSSFSLEIPMGLRFLTQSRMFTTEELQDLTPLHFLED